MSQELAFSPHITVPGVGSIVSERLRRSIATPFPYPTQEAKRQKRLEELRDAKRRAKEPSTGAANADNEAAAGMAGAEGSAEGKDLDGMTVTEVLYVFDIAFIIFVI